MGIIPARAGFTKSKTGRPELGGDHPRSRGVYGGNLAEFARNVGSSPLARGLPVKHTAKAVSRGIIPARAGFTGSCSHGKRFPQDHPRSRGVYMNGGGQATLSSGSSPLARGLPSWTVFGGGFSGIIPARAGFTIQDISSRSSRSDHPRSRGVYGRGSAT